MREKISGFEMYYEITGNMDGPWMVLLHGISGSTRCWKYQINDFNKYFKVINVDLAGHGNSTGLNVKQYSGEVVANHVRILMDKLGIEKAHFVGLSLGAIVLQYFCELFPERASSIVFASPITKPNYLSALSNSFADKVFLKLFSKNLYLKLMAQLMLPGKAHAKSRKFFLQETFKMDDNEFMKWWKLVVQGNHYFFISKSDIPALIVAGKKDFCFFSDAELLRDKFKNNEFYIINDAGHVFIFQKPEEFNKKVIEFVTRIEANKKDTCDTKTANDEKIA